MQKSNWITGLLIALAFTGAKAQFGGGVIAGLNFCQIDGDTYGGYGKIGANLGGYVHYPFSDFFRLQTEIMYNSRGARVGTYGYHLRLNYVDWAVLGNATILGDENQALMVHAGLILGYLINARSGLSGLIANVSNSFRKLDFQATAGFSFRATPHLNFLSRFHYSISDISAAADPTTSTKLVNRYITLAFRYEF